MLSRLPETSYFSFWLCFLFPVILKYVLWIIFDFKTKRVVYYRWMSNPTHNYVPFPFINNKGNFRFRLLISTRQSCNSHLNRVRLFKYKCVLIIKKSFFFFKTSVDYRRRYWFENVKVRFFPLAEPLTCTRGQSRDARTHVRCIFIMYHIPFVQHEDTQSVISLVYEQRHYPRFV